MVVPKLSWHVGVITLLCVLFEDCLCQSFVLVCCRFFIETVQFLCRSGLVSDTPGLLGDRSQEAIVSGHGSEGALEPAVSDGVGGLEWLR
jgi:hypothetical protein